LIDPLIGNIPFYPYFVLGIATTIVTPLYLFFQNYLQTRQQGGRYGINLLTNFLIQTGLIILFVAGFKMGVLGVLLAQLISAVLFFIYVLIAFVPKVKLGINKAILKPAFKYSLPLVPHLLAGWSTGLIDRLLINGLKNESDTGLYSVGNQFSSITSSLTNAVNMAYVPWFMESYEAKRFHDITKAGNAVVLLYCFVAFLVSMFCPEILKIMVTEKFQGVWNIIPLLSFACVLNGVYFLFVNTLFLQKTKYVFVITITALLFNLGLNLLLIPRYSYVGSAIACFVAYLVKSIVALIISRKEVKEIDFVPLRLYLFVFLFFSLTFVNFLTQDFGFIMSVLVKLIISGVLFVVFWYKYKSMILGFVNAIRKRK
jgi:O-antigen/teichoic acid export membrane protein